jgi:hypothetical protein
MQSAWEAVRTRLRTPQGFALPLFFAVTFEVLLIVHRMGDAHYDFGVFYYAAHMVNGGAGSQLYDLASQYAWQARFHRPPSQLFYYPPFALLPFMPLAWLPIGWAYAVWTAFSLALLAFNVKLLASYAQAAGSDWPWLAALAFMPVSTSLAHGQLSLVALTGFVLAWESWRHGRRFSGGLLLTLAAFKFQLIAGFLAVLVAQRKWKELAGVLCGGTLLLAVSMAIAGPHALGHYVAFVRQVESGVGSEPQNMANWRGMSTLFGLDNLAVVVMLTATALLWAVRAWTNLDRGISVALLASTLASYHMNPQDLSVCLVPFFLCWKQGILPAARVPAAAAVVLLVPMILAAVHLPWACMALLLAAALVGAGWPDRPK